MPRVSLERKIFKNEKKNTPKKFCFVGTSNNREEHEILSISSLLRGLVLQHLRDRQPALLGDHLDRPLQPEALDGRARVVERVARAQLLAERVLDARELEHDAHGASGDDAGTLGRGAQHHARGAEHAVDAVRERRAARERDRDHFFFGGDDGLLHGVDDLLRGGRADADLFLFFFVVLEELEVFL